MPTTTDGPAADPGEPPDRDRTAVRRFIRLDRVGALAGAILIVVANGLVYRSAGIWTILPFLLVLAGCLTAAGRSVDRPGDAALLRTLALVAVPNWIVSIWVPVVLPFLWPALALTVLMPVVLATPHLRQSALFRMLLVAAVVVGTVTAIGLLNDDGGALPDIEDELELVIVIGAMMAVIAPIGLIVWQHNHLQQSSLSRAAELNRRLQESQHQLAGSRRRVVEAADTERRRIERDLHDGAQQRLVALGVQLRLLESQGADDGTRETARSLVEEVDAAVTELRELAHGIYPPLLRSQGLPASLTAVARRSPLPTELALADVGRLEESVETALYFAALEAMTNAAKHAPASTLSITLARAGDEVVLTVTDDGPGFAVDDELRTLGTHNMGDRLAAVGGHLTIDSSPGGGTTVEAAVGAPSVGG